MASGDGICVESFLNAAAIEDTTEEVVTTSATPVPASCHACMTLRNILHQHVLGPHLPSFSAHASRCQTLQVDRGYLRHGLRWSGARQSKSWWPVRTPCLTLVWLRHQWVSLKALRWTAIACRTHLYLQHITSHMNSLQVTF